MLVSVYRALVFIQMLRARCTRVSSRGERASRALGEPLRQALSTDSACQSVIRVERCAAFSPKHFSLWYGIRNY
jgi:hypothetical protein